MLVHVHAYNTHLPLTKQYKETTVKLKIISLGIVLRHILQPSQFCVINNSEPNTFMHVFM